MSLITGLLYAALAAYLGGWYLGHWHGNFSLLLFILTVVTLSYWLAEKFKFRPDREAAAVQLVEQDNARRVSLATQGIGDVDGNIGIARDRIIVALATGLALAFAWRDWPGAPRLKAPATEPMRSQPCTFWVG